MASTQQWSEVDEAYPSRKAAAQGRLFVGYARPPEHTRFPNQANAYRGGRRRTGESLQEVLRRGLLRLVTVTENGRRRRITYLEYFVEKLKQQAASGDARARRDLIGLVRLYPAAAKPPLELRTIVPGMSVEEAAAIYAETLTAIPGMIEEEREMGPWLR